MMTIEQLHLTDTEYEAALAELADYEKRIAEATGLERNSPTSSGSPPSWPGSVRRDPSP